MKSVSMTLATSSLVLRRLGTVLNGQKRNYFKDANVVARAVATCSNQWEIDRVAKEKSIRLSAGTILFHGEPHRNRDKYLLSTARYLHRELPVRIAHRIKSLHSLPFIIGCNSKILRVHESYVHSFRKLYRFPAIEEMNHVKEYARLLQRLIEELGKVTTIWAKKW